MYKVAQCLAAHSPGIPKRLRNDILRSEYSDTALRSAEKQLFANTGFKGLSSTTQAINAVQGGINANALPELAWVVINHRISTERFVVITSTDFCLTLTNQVLWTKRNCTSPICSRPLLTFST